MCFFIRQTARWVIKVACSRPLGSRFPWRPWLNSSLMTFSCNCICVLTACVQESFLWPVVRRDEKTIAALLQWISKISPIICLHVTHHLYAQRKGKAFRLGGILREHNHVQCFWTACVLLFSCIFCFCPHMFWPWLLSSLGLYAIMLLGNCARRTRSVGCVRLSCEEHGGIADE